MPTIELVLNQLHATQQTVSDNLARFNVLRMGRRWGKTTLSQNYFHKDILAGYPCAFMSPTYKMLADVWREYKKVFEPIISKKNEQEKRLEFVTGGSLDFWSFESPDSIRGHKYRRLFGDEAAMVKELSLIWNEIILATLIDYKGEAILASTPRGNNDFRKLDESKDWKSFHYTTYDNPILEYDEIQAIEKSMTSRAARQEIYADYIDNAEDALFKIDDIDNNRVDKAPDDLHMVYIGVDPAVSSNAKSNMTGIIVAGKKDNDYYIMADNSGIYKPSSWAEKVVMLYDFFHVDRVVGEVNNGGELVEANLRNTRRNISYMAVRATRGKAVRAEPIAALYEQGKVHHVGELRDLETQMITWSPAEDESPDRVDAMVWAITAMMKKQEVTMIENPFANW